MSKEIKDMSIEELKEELARTKDNLCDFEEMHTFTFVKTSVHIGAEKAQNLQMEFEEECKVYNRKIADIERLLKEKNTF